MKYIIETLVEMIFMDLSLGVTHYNIHTKWQFKVQQHPEIRFSFSASIFYFMTF